MIKIIWLSFTFLFSSGSLASIPNATSKKALIYNGPGVCEVCPESAAELISQLGFTYEFIQPEQMTAANFSKASLYIQPGGTDRPSDIMEALTANQIHNLKNFVAAGGFYFGICSGGYLAGETISDEENTKGFGLLPLNISEEQEDGTPKLEKIIWNKKSVREVYFQDAPYFDSDALPQAHVFATYRASGHAAALINNYGQGRVGVVGPHLESTDSWFTEDNLKNPGSNYDLGIEFLKALTEPNLKSQ